MIRVRHSEARGYADHGWLQSHHSFSFASYYDPEHMGYSVLRTINDDLIAPGGGFGTHPHRDMEIVTYVLQGAVRHQDSMGNRTVIEAGEVQRMSAGSGIRHSEFNDSGKASLHLLQIWIVPDREGLAPEYEQKRFSRESKQGRLRLIVSPEGEDGALSIHQDARILAGILDAGDRCSYVVAPRRKVYLQMARGSLEVQGVTLHAGDGAMIEGETEIWLSGVSEAEVLLFDLP